MNKTFILLKRGLLAITCIRHSAKEEVAFSTLS